ncbi:serine/threonine protein kinase [Streptomyces microflavus]|uniref:serine/threonine protein kinase n=1 Tax=Streptomyces microflavus TaxID=1919 RepID=UPI003669CCF3
MISSLFCFGASTMERGSHVHHGAITLIPGTLLDGRYRVQRKLGNGGEGDIFIAQDEQHHREVAIKAQFPRSFESTATYLSAALPLQRELERLSFMNHLPGIPNVLGDGHYGRNNGRYIVMDLIEGVTILDWIAAHHPVPTVSAVSAIAQLCTILEGVHSQKYVHRDVCPKNAMLRTDGRAYLLDVGISGRAGEVNFDPRGTPPYAPPEQYDSEALMSPQVDVFSLGVMIFAMTSSELPYGHIEGPPDTTDAPFPNGLPPGASQDLLSLGLSMVAVDPRDRPNGVADVLRALEKMLPKLRSSAPSKAARPDPTTPYRLGAALL